MNSEQKSFFEFVPTPWTASEKKKEQSLNRISLERIFLAQSIDHALCLLIVSFWFALAFSLFESSVSEIISQASPLLWVSFLALLSSLAFLYRFFFVIFLGATPGRLFASIEQSRHKWRPQFWIFQLFESLQLAFPALWFLELGLRSQGLYAGMEQKRI